MRGQPSWYLVIEIKSDRNRKLEIKLHIATSHESASVDVIVFVLKSGGCVEARKCIMYYKVLGCCFCIKGTFSSHTKVMPMIKAATVL